jgi:hypothetical protein
LLPLGGDISPFLDLPLTPLERTCFASPALAPRGYLCLHLELYATHEPCVMCSMALLHSRFGRVVFWRAMPRTGGLVAERCGGAGNTTAASATAATAAAPPHFASYGLFWRSQLNWKFPCWQWRPDDGDEAARADHRLEEEVRLELRKLEIRDGGGDLTVGLLPADEDCWLSEPVQLDDRTHA